MTPTPPTTAGVWPTRTIDFSSTAGAVEPSLEWLVTNGLGGFASGPVGGGLTRRYHGFLIGAHPPPLGRWVFVSAIRCFLVVGDMRVLLDHEDVRVVASAPRAAAQFMLDGGLSCWRYEIGGVVIEKRVVMPYRQNTTAIVFRLISGDRSATLECEPMMDVRPLEQNVAHGAHSDLQVVDQGHTVDVELGASLPHVRMTVHGAASTWTLRTSDRTELEFIEERDRGYDSIGDVWTPCLARLPFVDDVVGLTLSTDVAYDADRPLMSYLNDERTRREALLDRAGPIADRFEAELILAADQFIMVPVGHAADAETARTVDSSSRSVIAGYHWFTDWGRDTMISLDGLTFATGRDGEGAAILRTFGHHVRDGLIPNLFPEGQRLGLYHTADATLWFFEALNRYTSRTSDFSVVESMMPTLMEILGCHREGTAYGIGVDPVDGLLRQGAPGYALTWMDAKMDGWVVTPRRGKAVEINALWYNALRLMALWLHNAHMRDEAARCAQDADRVKIAFNTRFWNDATGYLFDVVDGELGDDPACRPNQLFAISLPHPVLDEARWPGVLEVVRRQLLTPLGLRTLAPTEPAYQAKYFGDLRTRDGAYHQGTAWPWLIGAYVDALLKVAPDNAAAAREALAAFPAHLNTAGIGSISEIADAEAPHTPRGCIAQAWSVAEVLRAWKRTAAK